MNYNHLISVQKYIFYQGYYKDQRDAAVIILVYTMLPHNGVWEVFWPNVKKSMQSEVLNHVNNMYILRFNCGVDLVYFE